MPDDQHDAPPREAVEMMREAVAVYAGTAFRVTDRVGELFVLALRTLPAAARWRLIAWMAKGLEPTRGMVEAACRHAGTAPGSFGEGMVAHASVETFRTMLAAAAEAGDGE